MVQQKNPIKRRPELLTLPEVPTVLKISEVATGTSLMRINLPFTFTHLAKAGVKRAWILSRTGKSLMTVLGEDAAKLDEFRKETQELVYLKYPALRKHFRVQMIGHLEYGSNYVTNPESNSDMIPVLHYVADVPKFMQIMNDCGFSEMPLMVFQIMLDNPTMIITFRRHVNYKGFIASQYDRKPYDSFDRGQILHLIATNPILQNMKCHVCGTKQGTGVFEFCEVASGDEQ